MDEDSTDCHSNVLVALEVLRSAARQQNGQEVVDGIRENHHEPVQGGRSIHPAAEHEEQQDAFDQTCADHGRKQRNEDTSQGIHNEIERLFLRCRSICCRCFFLCGSFTYQFHELLINASHLAAENYLILFTDQIDAHNTGQLFDLITLDDRNILDNHAQSGDAMGHAGNIFFAADQVENLRGQFFICHTMLLLNLSCFPSHQELFDVPLSYHFAQ